jgi:adenylylsulfate kinase
MAATPAATAMTATPTYGELTNTGASTNIAWHHTSVDRAARAQQRGHRSAILWFTGLSGSGKSTLANALNQVLFERGLGCYVLDGDNIRHGLCKDLGFSDADREENIRRIGEVSKLFLDAGIVVLTAFVSPFRADRRRARALVEAGDFIEIHCAADLEVCEERDPKGLYAKARAGEIKEFTGISSPYEEPEAPELKVDTGNQTLEQCVEQVLAYLSQHGVVPSQS